MNPATPSRSHWRNCGPAHYKYDMLKWTQQLLTLMVCLALLVTGIWCTRGKSDAAPLALVVLPDAPALADAPDNSLPGLTLKFESTKDKATDARSARLLALNVPAGKAPTPFLEPGAFKATFEGFIEQRLRGDFDFTAGGNGKITITINDKPVLSGSGDLASIEAKKATLKKGKNKLVVMYESPAAGDALLRVYWASDEFTAEPIDPKLFTHSTTAKPIAAALRVREGRTLFADLHCIRCHTDASLADAKEGMPEMAKDAPNLDEAGARLKEEWVARWITNPKALRPDTSMPNVFHGKAGSTAKEGADIAAYLATLKPPAAEMKELPAEAIIAGGRIVARLGCVGCHTLADKEIGADPSRVPWRYVKAKYKPAGLVEFLKQPEKHFAWIRMPNFRFTDEEAISVAAYLLSTSKELEAPAAGRGDAVHGKDLVQSSGCVNCHALKMDNSYKAPALAAIAKEGWVKGCMAANEAVRGKAPDFGLSAGQRDALLAFAATDRSSLKREALPEFAERQITELRCIACHARDTKQDAWDELIKETEPLAKGDAVDPEAAAAAAANGKTLPGETVPGTGDQTRPPLTWAGEKLYPEWMSTFIAGKLDYKPRVWMLARMPGFPARAKGIALGLALEHGCPTVSPEQPKPDGELAKIGKQLMGRNGGFSCIQCHGVAKIAPISPFEAPSINFKYAKERIRREYYDRWMRNPQRVILSPRKMGRQRSGISWRAMQPNSLMRFGIIFRQGGKSSIRSRSNVTRMARLSGTWASTFSRRACPPRLDARSARHVPRAQIAPPGRGSQARPAKRGRLISLRSRGFWFTIRKIDFIDPPSRGDDS